jgi:hypothetical protein
MPGQGIPTKTAAVSAPKETSLPATTRAFPPPSSSFNLKQSHIEKHHLHIPMYPKGQGTRSFTMVKAGAETPVFSTRSGEGVKIDFIHPFANVETEGETSTVSEPTLAVRQNYILVTANWFASLSDDGGRNFRHILPTDVFPQTDTNPFCCDQSVIYDKAHDLMIWLLQYEQNDDGDFLRLAVSGGGDIGSGKWRYYDLSPSQIGGWKQQWFDFPDVVVGENYLYISTNLFQTQINPTTGTNDFARSVLMRIPLKEVSQYQGFSLRYFDTPDYGSLRGTQGATSVLDFASSRQSGLLRVFSWPEQASDISYKDVGVQDWAVQDYSAAGPDGNDWMKRTDSRLTAAWATKDFIGFGWTSPQDSFFHYPRVRLVVLRKQDKQVVAEPIIWNNEYAFALPAIAASPSGMLGLTLHYGGNTHSRAMQ